MPSDTAPEETLVTVATYDWLMHADLARSRLAACGIAAHLAEEFAGSIYWHYVRALGGLRLQVSSEDAEDALAVLREPPQATGEPILGEMESKADRFLRTAVLGVVAFPLLLYALWLLFDLFTIRTQLDERARRKVLKGAAVLTVFWGLPVAFSFVRVLRPY